MNTLYQDGKKIIMKKIGIFCLVCIAVLLCSALTWGNSVASLLTGTKPFEQYTPYLFVSNAENELNHAYFETEISLITGSYAEYGNVKEEQIENQTVYYLMPDERGDRFITVIAHGAITENLNAMENAFYQSIDKEDKEYPQPLTIKGGIKTLQPEELAYALDYFQAYDPTIKTEADMLKVMSPYAIVVNQIDSIATSSLWIVLILWILILLLLTIGVILYFSGICLKQLDSDIRRLPAARREQINLDYKKAVMNDPIKIGDVLLYQRERWTWRVYDYDSFIWIYQKENLHKVKQRFEVYAYTDKGRKILLYRSNEEKKAKKIAQRVFDHCQNTLFGYDGYIEEYWQEYPDKLYDKLVEMSLIRAHKPKTTAKPAERDSKPQPQKAKRKAKK